MDTTTSSFASTTWVLHNRPPWFKPWIVSEVNFYSDSDCSERLSTPEKVEGVEFSCCSNCASSPEDGLTAKQRAVKMFDDVWDKACYSTDENWMGCEVTEESETYIGYKFKEPQEVHCIEMIQAGCMVNIIQKPCLIAWNESGNEWSHVGSLYFPEATSSSQVTYDSNNCTLHADLLPLPPPMDTVIILEKEEAPVETSTITVLLVCSLTVVIAASFFYGYRIRYLRKQATLRRNSRRLSEGDLDLTIASSAPPAGDESTGGSGNSADLQRTQSLSVTSEQAPNAQPPARSNSSNS